MTLDNLRTELSVNNIKESSCLIFPRVPIEGALCLLKTDDGRYRVILNDRGDFVIDKTLQSEHEACRFFLKEVLIDPVNRKGFKQSDLLTWETDKKELLKKYGFNEK